MVVFPAPSSPRMRILISRVPNKLEKMVEKKPPTKTRRERHFNVSQLCGRYGKADRLTSFLTGLQDVSFLQWKKTSPGCCPDGCALNNIMSSWFMLPLYGSSLQQNTLQQHHAFSLQLQFYLFLFSFAKIWVIFLACIRLNLFSARDYTRTKRSLKEFSISRCLWSSTRPPTSSFLKIRYKLVDTCKISLLQTAKLHQIKNINATEKSRSWF